MERLELWNFGTQKHQLQNRFFNFFIVLSFFAFRIYICPSFTEMGIYSNVLKVTGESALGGVKYHLLFASAKAITTCPALPVVKTLDAHYQTAVGDFVFADENDGFNVMEAINRSGKLEWESVGSPGSLKSKCTVEFDVAGMQAALAKFTTLAKNDDLILIIERTDCTGKRYMIGTCCLPTQITKYKGTAGQKPEDDVKTTFTMEAYCEGMPIVLGDDVVLQLSGDFDDEDVNDDFS